MEDSALCLDVYSIIVSCLDWETLLNLGKVKNRFIYHLYKKEMEKRINSAYPLGDPKARIAIVTNDINLKDVYIILGDQSTLVPKGKYSLPCISNVINSWFIISEYNENGELKYRFTLTSKVFKSIIRIINKRISENDDTLINETRQELIFRFQNNETVLEDVI